jgi:hypothetical protein
MEPNNGLKNSNNREANEYMYAYSTELLMLCHQAVLLPAGGARLKK